MLQKENRKKTLRFVIKYYPVLVAYIFGSHDFILNPFQRDIKNKIVILFQLRADNGIIHIE